MRRRGQTRMEQAIEFLEVELCAGFRVPALHIGWAAETDGIAPRTLRRAKKRLGVCSEKDGWTGQWLWSLPSGHPSLLFPEDS